MLLPLIGFVAGVTVSSILGLIFLAIHPKWKINFANLALFVFGSFLATIGGSYLFSKIFADNEGVLQSKILVMGYLGFLAVAVLGGGILSIFLGRKILKKE